MTKAERETILNEWREAYRKANGKEPPKVYNRDSWWYITGSHGAHRISEFPAMTQRLLERANNESN